MRIFEHRPRTGLLLVALSMGAFASACEDDGLVPTNRTNPPTCEEDDRYCGISGQLDGGGMLDSGVVLLDAGVPDAGDTDAGLQDTGIADAGLVDTGVDAGPPPPDFIDLEWQPFQTYYSFDWSDALFGINSIGTAVRAINVTFAGNLEGVLEDDFGVPGFLATLIAAVAQPIIDDFVQNNVPQWFLDLINILDNLAAFFENVDVKSQLDVTHGAVDTAARTRALVGTDNWQTVYLHIRDRCPATYTTAQIEATGCDLFAITAAPTSPAIPANPCTPMSPTIKVVPQNPFAGTQSEGRPRAAFEFSNPRREADIDVYGLIVIVLDEITRAATNGAQPTFRCAVLDAVDCNGIANAIAAQQGGVAVAVLEQACRSTVDGLVVEIIQQAYQANVGWNIIEFDQMGDAVDTNADNRADTLQSISASDTLPGKVEVLTNADLTGEWCAPRGLNSCPNPP